MKCPLPILICWDRDQPTDVRWRNCLKEECAWWIEYIPPDGEPHSACALVHIADRLFTILAKMPHELQFRK